MTLTKNIFKFRNKYSDTINQGRDTVITLRHAYLKLVAGKLT